MKIVFFGNTYFSVHILNELLQGGYQIPLIVTGIDSASGRGQTKAYSPVKKYAIKHRLNIEQPTSLKDINFINKLETIGANAFVVVAFKLLPRQVWDLAPTFNLHTSLLPQYRGAAPVERAIMNGECESGVTTFFINDAVDCGNIILQAKVPILETDNAGMVTEKMAESGYKIVRKTLEQIASGCVSSRAQNLILAQDEASNADLKYAHKINKEDLKIYWERPSIQIYNHIRALSPKYGAYTYLNDKIFKIFAAEVLHDAPIKYKPGVAFMLARNILAIQTSDGYIIPQVVQLQNKRQMTTKDFINGYRLDYPVRLSSD